MLVFTLALVDGRGVTQPKQLAADCHRPHTHRHSHAACMHNAQLQYVVISLVLVVVIALHFFHFSHARQPRLLRSILSQIVIPLQR